MNFLPLVMSLMLIFACTFSLSLRKAQFSQEVDKTYQAHVGASHKLRNSYESLCYQRLRESAKEKKEPTKPGAPKEKKLDLPNLDCARLNLWPLLVDGKEKHPVLYETAAQLIRSTWGQPLFAGQKLEYPLLDAILAAAQKQMKDTPIPFEKLVLSEGYVKPLDNLQTVYYRMLRGTKQDTPSFLDYFVIEKRDVRVCMQHASKDLLVSFFGEKGATALMREMQENDVPLSMQRVQDICHEQGRLDISDEFLAQFDWKISKHHSSGQKTLVQKEGPVSLKQKFFLPS